MRWGSMRRAGLFIAALLVACAARAETAEQTVEHYAAQTKAEDPNFSGFSAAGGEAFYKDPHTTLENRDVLNSLRTIEGDGKGVEYSSPHPIGGAEDLKARWRKYAC
jgi:hypothetical protein